MFRSEANDEGRGPCPVVRSIASKREAHLSERSIDRSKLPSNSSEGVRTALLVVRSKFLSAPVISPLSKSFAFRIDLSDKCATLCPKEASDRSDRS